ncbi:PhoH family protein [Marinagarivorans cellulosilyticus]|uniref:Phosphate starvation-inducible protein PhoH and related proteins n=1 Tax=Marinagarivorans cellulosilyticus TaxID=2721545 RepID=A0AAN2BM76_9GAMM|nr:PhoH family protein [Marinagarivorans cellulosilyticus]BCD99795.1 phosphate starvation-inducible protein PhoH and related proteins [Marinagarivorans cellulosilyticus]
MAKRASAKRNATYQAQNSHHGSGRSNQRKKGNKHQNLPGLESAEIFELNARQQVSTAYAPQQDLKPLRPRTKAQKDYINAIKNSSLTFGIGPAGTGKSYCAGALAAEAMQNGQIERIIITRPAVEAGENLGFLPGDIDEKFAAYIDAFRDILNERLGAGTVKYLMRHGRIVAAPLAYMRGRTFKEDTFVILDEAQNTTPSQMKMFLTRIGENCKVVINGDIKQSDIKGPNGLGDAIKRLGGLNNVAIHEFDRDDIVRSGLVRAVIDRYEMD